MYKNAKDFLDKNPMIVVLQEPDPFLRLKAEEVKDREGISELVKKMFSVMKEEGGIGLAAPQIGFSQRLFVIEIPATENREEVKIVAINPKILNTQGNICLEEGCLSVEGKLVPVERSREITVSFEDVDGSLKKAVLRNLAAVCFQHELDHLDGILISDYEVKL